MAETYPSPAETEPASDTEVAPPPKRRRGLIVIAIVVAVLIALGVWWRSTYSEDTDDAQINGHLIQISSGLTDT